MNLLPPAEREPDYGSITVHQHEEQRRQKNFQRCSKKTSILMSLLACCILAIGMFVWFQLIAKRHYGAMGSIADDTFGRGGDLGHILMSEDTIDYRQVSNADWRQLWLAVGYDEDTVNDIDFHTYSMLGVDYQKIYRDLNKVNHDIFNAKTNNDAFAPLLLPSTHDCACSYCLGFCEDIYCPICMHQH